MQRRIVPLLVLIPVICLVVVLLSPKDKQNPPSADGIQQAANGARVDSAAPGSDDKRPPRLIVRSTPAGASLMVNGRLMGATPVTLDAVPAGAYGLRLEKEGCIPAMLSVSVGSGDATVDQKLDPWPTGSVSVEVQPDGAEVLLDGEVVGHTPVKLPSVPVGNYELLIRKTNFEPYSRQIAVESGDTLSFSGFELKDKVLEMMEGMVRTEPQRVAHYIDLGHYLFINNKMDQAVDIFTQGREVMQSPLDFNGTGYAGKNNMSLAEIQLEERLRKEDEARYMKELDKHRNWPRIDTKTFRKKMDEADEMMSRKNIASWMWAERAARMHVANRNYDRAAKTYEEHIDAAKGTPDLPRAYTALAEIYLVQHDVKKADTLFQKFFELYETQADALSMFGKAVSQYHDRVIGQKDRTTVLSIAEKALHKAAELPNEDQAKTQTEFDLANVLVLLGRPADAIPYFELVVAETADISMREDRQLRMGDALRKAGRLDKARELFSKLSQSERTSIREAAKTNLEVLANEEKKRKPQGTK